MTSRTIIKSSGYNFARHKSGSFEINFSENIVRSMFQQPKIKQLQTRLVR